MSSYYVLRHIVNVRYDFYLTDGVRLIGAYFTICQRELKHPFSTDKVCSCARRDESSRPAVAEC
jgi:hypothetical protein